jgi:AraC-like DNA-binding protein
VEQLPGHKVGVVLHLRQYHAVAGGPPAAQTLGEQVDRLGGAAQEDDLARRGGIDPATHALAGAWLKDQDLPLLELAGRLGYLSEAALSRAFKRTIAISPGADRRGAAAARARALD